MKLQMIKLEKFFSLPDLIVAVGSYSIWMIFSTLFCAFFSFYIFISVVYTWPTVRVTKEKYKSIDHNA